MSKIYCFLYDLKENKCYRQEHECCTSEHSDNYRITLGEDSYQWDVFICEDEIDRVRNFDNGIYIYTFNDNVNHAMDLFYDFIFNAVIEITKRANHLENTLRKVASEKERIAQKYPNGRK